MRPRLKKERKKKRKRGWLYFTLLSWLYFTLLSWLHYDQWNTLSLPLPRNGIGTGGACLFDHKKRHLTSGIFIFKLSLFFETTTTSTRSWTDSHSTTTQDGVLRSGAHHHHPQQPPPTPQTEKMFDVTLSLAPEGEQKQQQQQQQQQQELQGEDSPSSSSSSSSSVVSPGQGVRRSTVVLRRDYQEFRALHLALTNLLDGGGSSSKVSRDRLLEDVRSVGWLSGPSSLACPYIN
jgi:hypothetical protein